MIKYGMFKVVIASIRVKEVDVRLSLGSGPRPAKIELTAYVQLYLSSSESPTNLYCRAKYTTLLFSKASCLFVPMEKLFLAIPQSLSKASFAL